MNFKANCQCTAIGSLPYKDVDTAVSAILKNMDIVFWPQLPKANKYESMVVQFSEKLPCVSIKGDSLLFDGDSKDRELEGFYERIISDDTDYFAISIEYAKGLHSLLGILDEIDKKLRYVKGHITGPFTFASAIKDKQGKSLLSDPVMLEACVNLLARKALWQVKKFKEHEKSSIIFIDEPYLGCFGSAYTPINKEDVVRYLTDLINMIKIDKETLVGVHCCGNTDWGVLLGLDIDIISFDAFGFLDKFILFAKDAVKFVRKGKNIAWGIVPTIEYRENIIVGELVNSLEELAIKPLVKLGLDRERLLSQSLFTPSCGLGSLDMSKDKALPENILRTTKDVSNCFKNKSL